MVLKISLFPSNSPMFWGKKEHMIFSCVNTTRLIESLKPALLGVEQSSLVSSSTRGKNKEGEWSAKGQIMKEKDWPKHWME